MGVVRVIDVAPQGEFEAERSKDVCKLVKIFSRNSPFVILVFEAEFQGLDRIEGCELCKHILGLSDLLPKNGQPNLPAPSGVKMRLILPKPEHPMVSLTVDD